MTSTAKTPTPTTGREQFFGLVLVEGDWTPHLTDLATNRLLCGGRAASYTMYGIVPGGTSTHCPRCLVVSAAPAIRI